MTKPRSTSAKTNSSESDADANADAYTRRAVERLVFPLDVDDLDEARTWIRRLAGEVGVFKVGLELFTAVGPDAVRAVHDAGARCFLDLKLHDIPATMAGAVRASASLGVAYLTIHTSAGPVAMRACADAIASVRTMRPPTKLLGVTVLTSVDEAELHTLGVAGSPAEAVERLAGLATASGLAGLVCSPHECARLRASVGAGVELVVPGIRPTGASLGDQKRAATPTIAIREGADLLVVGRPIREAEDPVQAARAIVAEIAAELARGASRGPGDRSEGR